MGKWLIIVGLVSSVSYADFPSPEKVLENYVASQMDEILRIADAEGMSIDSNYRTLLKAAENDDWAGVSNAFFKIRAPGKHQKHVLWHPSLELYGVMEQFQMWPHGLLDLYATEIISVISPNAIYFGGTDPGRFVLNAYAESSEKPFYVITQNALADNNYAAYERNDSRNSGIWLPQTNDVSRAFQQYVQGVKAGKINAAPATRTEGGKVQVQGVAAFMRISGFISQQIHANNKASHDFFVEESYTLPWMYPYLEPCGPIMKINAEKTAINREMIVLDQAYWDALTKKLLDNPAYADCKWAKLSFSKMRCAIGGLYAARGKPTAAKYAFHQAVKLYPDSPEATFRLADLLAKQGNKDEAVELMEAFVARNPNIKQGPKFLEQLKNQKMQLRKLDKPVVVGGQPNAKGEFERALANAEAGKAGAMLMVARMYDAGKGVEKDLQKGFEWRKKAAESGMAMAQAGLAASYARGQVCPKDLDAALEWRMKAAAQGYAQAMHAIGKMYEKGEGVPKDPAKALEWFQRGAKLGNSYALNDAGRYYEKGIGTQKNIVRAYAYTKCSEINLAQKQLKKIADEMTAQQIAEGDRLASQMKEVIAQNKPK